MWKKKKTSISMFDSKERSESQQKCWFEIIRNPHASLWAWIISLNMKSRPNSLAVSETPHRNKKCHNNCLLCVHKLCWCDANSQQQAPTSIELCWHKRAREGKNNIIFCVQRRSLSAVGRHTRESLAYGERSALAFFSGSARDHNVHDVSTVHSSTGDADTHRSLLCAFRVKQEAFPSPRPPMSPRTFQAC